MNKNLHQNHRPFNFQSKPAKSILDLFQKSFNIISLSISSQGSNGVIFIQTDRGSVVLKSSNQGPRDEFLNRLASILNLSVPQSICFTCSDKEFDVIMFKIEKFCQKDEILYARIKTKLDFPFYQIIQYIPSISHAEIGPERYQKLMSSEHKLHMLGMCLGFDLIINNSDRFKLVWASDGNLSNVLIKVQSHDDFSLKEIRDRENVSINLGNYVFIDHQGNLLDLTNPHATNNFQQYLALITNFYVQLIRYLGEETQPPQPFNSLRKQIQLYSQYFLTDIQIKSIGKGIIYITNQFIRLFETQKIQDLYNSLIKVVQGNSKQKNQQTNIYWNNYWNNQLQKVKISYLNEMYTKIQAIFTTYPQTIHQTLQETKNVNAVIIKSSTPTIQTPKKSLQDQNSKQLIQQRSENEIMMNNSKQNLSEKRETITEIQKNNIQEKRITNNFQRGDVIKQQQIDIDTKLSQSKVAKDRKWRDKLKLFSSINANQH